MDAEDNVGYKIGAVDRIVPEYLFIIMLFQFYVVCENDIKKISKFRPSEGEWIAVPEARQELSHHPISSKNSFVRQIADIRNHRTVTLRLTDEESTPYLDGDLMGSPSNDDLLEDVISVGQSSNSSDSILMANAMKEIVKMQQESMKTLLAVVNQSLLRRESKMQVTRFDGTIEDAKIWMKSYEKACKCNQWDSDEQKINNLKPHLEGIALKWFNSRLAEDYQEDWEEWKESFLISFSQNRFQMAFKALNWQYRGGPLMDFYYEKQRLLQMAFENLNDFNFINLIALGLPSDMQQQLLQQPLSTREDLRKAFDKLKPILKDKGKNIEQIKAPIGPKASSQFFTLLVNNKPAITLFDTGSTVNLINVLFVKRYQFDIINSSSLLRDYNGITFPHIGSVKTILSFNGKTIVDEAIISTRLDYDFLLGFPAISALKLCWDFSNGQISNIYQVVTILSAEDAKSTFPNLIPDGKVRDPIFEVDFSIRTDYVVKKKPYRMSHEKRIWLKNHINDLISKGWLSHSDSEYASPTIVVPKENGDLRACQDYREINKLTELDPYPVQSIDDIINDFGGCTRFTKLDLKDAFRLIGLTITTRKYTAFVTEEGHYEWNRLPYGWKNSPAKFQRIVGKVLSDVPVTYKFRHYVDDIGIGGRTDEELGAATYEVLKRLNSAQLYVNFEKSVFNVPKIKFVGRYLDGFSKSTKQESIEKVKLMKRPQNVHEVRCFTGLTGHFRAFIKNYADIVRPLDELKKKDVPFIWTAQCEDSFITLKEKISSNPILQVPDWSLPFELCTDASHYGTGSILYQRDIKLAKNLQLRVIGYQSYTFNKAEINYPTTQKEALAVIKALKYFRGLIDGKEITVHTDHQALTHIITLKEPKGRIGRWQIFLQSFQININHRSGKELTNADAISRLCLDIKQVSSIQTPIRFNIKDGHRFIVKPEERKVILWKYHDDISSGGHS
ncbi:gag-pol fusion protein-like protein, partial [Dinothrombium tinctorium]